MILSVIAKVHGKVLSQAALEHIFRSHLARYGCTVELGTELVGVAQDADGVTATLLVQAADGTAEKTETVRCEFLVGADGAKGDSPRLSNVGFD